MAINTKISIEIEGERLTSFSELKINQKVNDHHAFSVTRVISKEFVAEAMDKSQKYIGQTIRINIESNTMKTNSSFIFFGIITNAEMIRSEGASGLIIIDGFSPSIVMDGMPNIKSFNDKSFGDIIRELSANYPQQELKPNIDIYNDSSLLYTVQYGETDFGFLRRMAQKKGQWFYYNGQQTFFGRPKSKTIDLIYGHNLHKLNIGMQAKPLGFEYLGYDASSAEVQKANSKEINFQAQGYSKSVYDSSRKMYPDMPTSLYSNPMQEGMSRNHLIDRVTTQLQSKAANLVMAKGETDETGIRIGDVLVIKESSFSPTGNLSDGVKEQNFGSYIVTNVIHSCDISGRYSNTFEAVPDSVLTPPYGNVFAVPAAEIQPAIVIDNNDPLGLGRVQVQMNWQKYNSSNTPWIRMTNPHAGGGKGMYFIPEIGEEVLVGFEGGNAEKPFVLGTMYNGNEISGYATQENNIKAIQTRSGHIIKFTEDQSIIITDKSGNEIHLDTVGSNINITAPNTINISATDINISASKNITVTAGVDQTTVVGMNQTTSVGMINNTFVGANNLLNIIGSHIENIEGSKESHTKEKRIVNSEKGIESSSNGSINKHSQKQIQNRSGDQSKAH